MFHLAVNKKHTKADSPTLVLSMGCVETHRFFSLPPLGPCRDHGLDYGSELLCCNVVPTTGLYRESTVWSVRTAIVSPYFEDLQYNTFGGYAFLTVQALTGGLHLDTYKSYLCAFVSAVPAAYC